MSEENLTPEQSMGIINRMILDAKKRYQSVNIYFLLWGSLLFAAGIADYILIHEYAYKYHWIVWMIQGIVGGIASAIIGRRQSMEGSKTFLDEIIATTWIGFTIALITIIFVRVYQKSSPSVDIMILTGLATMVTGAVIRFVPLIVGGVAFWIFAFITVLAVPEHSELMFSLSILTGYLIPGFLLKRKEASA